MPTHAEQTRAILEARQFLDWLTSNCKAPYPMVAPAFSLPMKLRQEAARIAGKLPEARELLGWRADIDTLSEALGRPPLLKAQEHTGDRPAGRAEDRQPLFSSRPPWPE